MIGIVLRREGSAENVKKYGHFARFCKNRFKQHSAQTKPSKQPPLHRHGRGRFMEREEKPTLSMRLLSRVKMIHLLLL